MADKDPKDKGEVTDYGFEKTDEQLKDLEARLSSLYADASKDMQNKLDDFLDQFKKMDEAFAQNVKDGKWTADMYNEWRDVEVMRSKQMQLQIEQLTEDLVKTDVEAMQIVNGELPSIFVTNYNYQGYKAEMLCEANGIEMNSFTIYNKDAVARIMRDDPDLLPIPNPKVDIPKDKKWNKQKINTAIAQGITQGESMDKIAARLQAVTDMDYNAAIRNARTATIGAQNAGRSEAADRIRKSGLDMNEEWSAVHDARTRQSHTLLDGTFRQKDGYFHTMTGAKLRFPCDPNGAAGEVYNCRCRLNPLIAGIDHSKDDLLYEQFMEENYYEDWLSVKEGNEAKEKAFYKTADEALLKDYEKRKSETPAPKVITYGGHINDGISYKNRNYEFTDEGREQIAKDLGVSIEKAKEYEEAIDKYSAGGFRSIRAAACGQNDDPELKKKADAIEEFIDKSPKWNGGQIMRGVYVENPDNLAALIDAGKSGDAIDMLGMSSWTSNKEVAESYARVKSAGGEGKNVIFITNEETTDFGTSIKHLSRFKAEDEVLISGKADFVPTKVVKRKKAIYIYGDLKEADNEK